MENFKEFWRDLEFLSDLEEAYFPMRDEGSREAAWDHWYRHNKGENKLNFNEYQEFTNRLTSSAAQPLNRNWEFLDIAGYVSQNGKQVKAIKLRDQVYLAAYVRDPVKGRACTCYDPTETNFWNKINPYQESDKKDDLRYFCDLDGDLTGLRAFTRDKSRLPSKLLDSFEERLQSKVHLPKGKLEPSDRKSDIQE